jgi:hypothetical protein
MATLLLSDTAVAAAERFAPPVSLRSWMGQDWVILFSHPDDFVSCDLELDRWVTLAKQTFDRCGVRPLALFTPGQSLDVGWVTQASGDDPSTVTLLRPMWRGCGRSLDRFEPGGCQLRQELFAMRQRDRECRFVTVIDSRLRRRWTYVYDRLNRVPSPLEVAYRAMELRADESANEPRVAHSHQLRTA